VLAGVGQELVDERRLDGSASFLTPVGLSCRRRLCMGSTCSSTAKTERR
jgi:hypothetical protein